MSEPVVRLVEPPVEIRLVYQPGSQRLELHAAGTNPDHVVVALVKALYVTLQKTVKVSGP